MLNLVLSDRLLCIITYGGNHDICFWVSSLVILLDVFKLLLSSPHYHGVDVCNSVVWIPDKACTFRSWWQANSPPCPPAKSFLHSKFPGCWIYITGEISSHSIVDLEEALLEVLKCNPRRDSAEPSPGESRVPREALRPSLSSPLLSPDFHTPPFWFGPDAVFVVLLAATCLWPYLQGEP